MLIHQCIEDVYFSCIKFGDSQHERELTQDHGQEEWPAVQYADRIPTDSAIVIITNWSDYANQKTNSISLHTEVLKMMLVQGFLQ